ncbi:MAG: pyruvate kinase, partial [Pseudomonadota bacterium]
MRNRSCKIVATVGPASSSPSMIELLHRTGVDVFRLNYSHGNHDALSAVVDAIRATEQKAGSPIAILADLQGPKIRVGSFPGDGLKLPFQGTFRLTAQDTAGAGEIPVPHPEVISVLEEGDLLKFDDGRIQMSVVEKTDSGVIVRADVPGTLKSKKGLNLPGRALPISALTEKDHRDLEHALGCGVDVVALSFVQRSNDIIEAKEKVQGRARVIAKIEKPCAVDDLDDIISHADGLMVARGDLGVELPPEQVPGIQRRIVAKARQAGKPVIVATHMLESMIEETAPTRAEASDIATAVSQGTDAVMLSAETAVGRHPATAVAIMDRIIFATENDPDPIPIASATSDAEGLTTADAVTLSARRITEVIGVRFALAYTKSGSTARRLSRDRPNCPIIAATPSENVARSLAIQWGTTPVVTDDITHFH